MSPEEHKIIITESPKNPKKNREAIVELMYSSIFILFVYVIGSRNSKFQSSTLVTKPF